MAYQKHGMYQTKLYGVWESMKTRCQCESAANYHLYGSRGIKVCDEWQHFVPFKDWAIANGFIEGLSLDRIDVNGDYSPDNCRWVTMKEQQNNRRNNRLITHNGETHTVSEWCEILGITKNAMRNRIRRGWSIDRILSTKTREYEKHRRI